MSKSKEVKELVKKLQDMGWRTELNDNGHWVTYPPNKDHKPIYFGSTPSDSRWLANTTARIRRAGGDI